MGFDTYKEDKSLNFLLDLDDYNYIGNRLTNIKIPKNHIFAVLEGGYHDKILECTESFIRGFNVS
jgi:acetoin utilization deacetylase AcuC-like enzyme